MRKAEQVILSNMCMVYDDQGNVLVQDRVDKEWSGITFPGGHVEATESFCDAVIREVWEETGLRIEKPHLCGVQQWHENDIRYVVLCYKTNCFSGILTSSEEGEMRWVKQVDFLKLPLASGMERIVQLFWDDDINEHYCHKKNDEWLEILK